MKIGQTMPSFSLKGVDDQIINSKDFLKGKGLVVIFSCNHCPYVQAYEDRMIALYNEFSPRGIEILVINSNEDIHYPDDSFENMKRRAKDKAFPFPYLKDESQDVAKAFGATHTPEIFLMNSDGELVYTGRIDDNWKNVDQVKSQDLKDAMNALISNEPIRKPETYTIGCTIKWKS